MRPFAGLVLLAILGSPARADWGHWWRFEDLRVSSVCNRWSAIVTREGREPKVRVEIYERRADGDDRRDVPCPWPRWDRMLQPREGERLVGCCEVDTVPRHVYMTHAPPRLVFVDSHRVGRGRLVTVIDPSGRELVRYDMSTLFPGRTRVFGESISRAWWSDWHFFSHRRLVLVVNRGRGPGEPLDYTYSSCPDKAPHELVAVSLADGSLVPADPRWVLRHALDRRSTHRGDALTIARTCRVAEALPIAERIAFDPTEPMRVRLHAADTAVALGSTRSVKRLFLDAAKEDGPARHHAIRRLGRVLGAPAVPVLRSLLDNDIVDLWDVDAALASLGPAIAPTMFAWLDDPHAEDEARMVAAIRLGSWKPPGAVESLYRTLDTGPSRVASWAAHGLAAIHPPDLVDRFCRVLRAGGPGAVPVARYFEMHPTERARSALETARRHTMMAQGAVEGALHALDLFATIRRAAALRPR